MAKTWRREIQNYGSLGAISFEKAFTSGLALRITQNGRLIYHCKQNIAAKKKI
jgi:hypothetical protein